MNLARLLADEQDVLAARRDQHRRGAEVVVGAQLPQRARGPTRTAGHEVVVGRGLGRPLDGARLHVEGDDRVGAVGRRFGVGIARANVERLALQVDDRGHPHGPTGRSVHLAAGHVAAGGARIHDLGLPDDAVGFQVEFHHGAGEGAAAFRADPAAFLEGGGGDVHVIADDHRRPGQAGERMALDLDAPQRLSRLGVDGVVFGDALGARAAAVAIVGHPARGRGARAALDDQGGAGADGRGGAPVDAASLGVQRIDRAGYGGQEQVVADHRRLAVALGVRERPFDLKFGHIARPDARLAQAGGNGQRDFSF